MLEIMPTKLRRINKNSYNQNQLINLVAKYFSIFSVATIKFCDTQVKFVADYNTFFP